MPGLVAGVDDATARRHEAEVEAAAPGKQTDDVEGRHPDSQGWVGAGLVAPTAGRPQARAQSTASTS